MGDSDEAKVYVGNLTYTTSNDDLKELFKECGAVQSVNIIVDRDSGQSKGFGFVTFESSKSAGEAIKKFNDCEFNGRCLNVNTPKPQSERRNRGGGYGGGGGGGYGGGGGGYGGGGGGRGGRGGGGCGQQNYGGGGGGF